MKSIKNHFSLVVALLSILFSIQIFSVIDRSVDAYKKNLADNYSIIVVAQKIILKEEFLNISKNISNVEELSPDGIVKKLNSTMDNKNIELLKVTLPRFYKLHISKFPTPDEVKELSTKLLKNRAITKIEDFSHNHDNTYKFLLLFKNVISVFSVTIFIVTILLIFKELKIWQYQHNERMTIMGLFGAPVWLRSAVLFRLAITDAIIATVIVFSIFTYISKSPYILNEFSDIGINIVIYDKINDTLILLATSVTLSLLLASLIVLGHREEV